MATPSEKLKEIKDALPGGFIMTDSGDVVFIIDKKEGDLYDTLTLGNTTAVQTTAAGHTRRWYNNVATKGRQFTNFETDQEVPAGWYMAVTKMGVHFKNVYGNTLAVQNDVLRIAENYAITFWKVRDIKKESPPIFWQSGHGWNGATAVNNGFWLSPGVPSPAAIPAMKKTFTLKPKDTIRAEIQAEAAVLPDEGANAFAFPVISTAHAIMLILHGLILESGVRA
jgi:hypothetical protein